LTAERKVTSGVHNHKTTSSTAVASATLPPLNMPDIVLWGPAENIAEAKATHTPVIISDAGMALPADTP
jgi:hypothetical protein